MKISAPLLIKVVSLSMIAFGVGLRILFLPAFTLDMIGYFNWYEHILENGIINSLGDNFAIYTPPYLYLLSIATLADFFLPKIISIKLINIAFDIINLFLVFQIIEHQTRNKDKALLGASIFWVAPTVMINSSFWGEVDSIYTCFLLLCFLYLLKERHNAAIISFAISISIKAQSVFMLPLLAVLFFKQRVAWKTFFWIPVIYFVMMLPAVMAGRSITSVAFAYLAQGREFELPNMNAANYYYFIQPDNYRLALSIGIPLAALVLLIWVMIYGLKKYPIQPQILMLTCIVSLTLTPFLLPKMHDRYFYPADIFSIITAFYFPGMWFVPIAYQIISLLSYMPYLFSIEPDMVIPPAVLINTLVISFLIYAQTKMTQNEHKKQDLLRDL